jgi:hypothetical protein
MWEDPVVAEVHRAREQIAASYQFNISAFFADLRQRQASLGSRLIVHKLPDGAMSAPAAEEPDTELGAAEATLHIG